jgi:hypothetical protein
MPPTDKLVPVVAEFAPEGGHWYNTDGKVVELVPDAKGKRLIPPDIRHARKLGLVPGVTTVTSQLRNERIVRYRIEQVLDAYGTLPRLTNEPEDSFRARVVVDADQHKVDAIDLGNLFHAQLHRYFAKRILPDTEAGVTAVHQVDDWLRDMGARDLDCERGFCLPGKFGGKPDLRFVGSDDFPCIVDYKTIEDDKLAGWRKPYPEHGWQLAGYRVGLGWPDTTRLINVAIGRTSGACKWYEWTAAEKAKNARIFNRLLGLWHELHDLTARTKQENK